MKQKAIIVDVDGTIADISHRLHFVKRPNKERDFKSFFAEMHKDKPKKNVIEVIESLWFGAEIIFVTARPEKYRKVTENWLFEHCELSGTLPTLFMAPDKLGVRDEVFKAELYEKKIKPKYRVIAVFDDRQRVVDMWRKKGLTCLQVDQWEEFDDKT